MFISSSKIFWGSPSEASQGPTKTDGSQLLLGAGFSWTSGKNPLPSLLCWNACRRISCAFSGVLGKRQNIQRMSNLHVITEFHKWEGMWNFPDCMAWEIRTISDFWLVLCGPTMWSCLDVHMKVRFPVCYFPFLSHSPFLSPALANYQCGLLICSDFHFLSSPCCAGWNCTRLFGSDCSSQQVKCWLALGGEQGRCVERGEQGEDN